MRKRKHHLININTERSFDSGYSHITFAFKLQNNEYRNMSDEYQKERNYKKYRAHSDPGCSACKKERHSF